MPKPLHTARCNSVRIRVTHGGKGTFCVAWRRFAGGPRGRETFTVLRAAKDRADEIARALANGQAESLTLSGADRETFRRAAMLLAPTGVPLHTAVEEWLHARELCAPHSVAEAAAHFARHHAARATGIPTSEIIAQILQSLEHDPQEPRTPAYLRTLRPRLSVIASLFPDLAAIEAETVDTALRALRHPRTGRPISAKTYNHMRGAFSLVWKWALARTKATGITGPNPLGTSKASKAPGKREVYTPAELRLQIAHAPEEWIPILVLGAFAGMRVCEIGRLAWTDIFWEAGEIRIDEHAAGKRGSPRNIPMCDALRAWLAPWRTRVGLIYGWEDVRLARETRKLHGLLEARIEGFRWKENAHRHSFGSYHVALHRNIELTRAIMGTSASMLRHHYNNPRFAADAAAWFALLPDDGGKILHITVDTASGLR